MTRSAAALAAPMLAGAGLNLALVGLAVARYPAIFGAERVPFVLVDVAILLGYGAAAGAMASIADEGRVRALASATCVGLVAGVLQGLEIVREGPSPLSERRRWPPAWSASWPCSPS